MVKSIIKLLIPRGWDFLENTSGKGFKNTIPYPLPQPPSCGFEDLHAAEF